MKSHSKILIDLERLRYPHSGLATVFRNLAVGIAKINPHLDITFFAPKISDESFSTNTVVWQKWHKFYENFSSGYDVIHVSHQLSSYFQKKYKNTAKIVTLHDLNFLHENISVKKRKKLLGKVNKNLRYCDHLVCISDFVKQDFLKNSNLFSFKNKDNISVIYNGIILPEDREYQLGRFEFLQNKEYILNIGVLFEKKNQMSLIEMLPNITQDLVLVYSDEKQPYADLLRQKIKDLQMENRVHLLHKVSEEEKYALIQNCVALFHPSVAEGFGIPPIEAMAFGKPVFLSKFTSLPEIGGKEAFYFDDFEPKNMAQNFKDNMKIYEDNADVFALKIKNRAKQFDYTVMTGYYLNLYETVGKSSIS